MGRRRADIISLHTDGERPPVVFFHTWGTEGDHIGALAEQLGPSQPLYGIEPPQLDGGPLPQSVPEWLAHHRHQLESLGLTPPYRFAGFSFGGVIALEMTRQLRAEGSTVAWTGLIDCTRPKLNPRGLRYVTYHWRELRDLPAGASRRRYLRKRLGGGGRRTALRLKVRVFRGLAALHVGRQRAKTLGDAKKMSPETRSIWRSYLSYEPEPFDGPVALFAGAESRRKSAGDAALGWSRYLSRLTAIAVDGDHLELFAPENVGSIAAAMTASLVEIDDRRSSSRT